jgi:hypothetical protein
VALTDDVSKIREMPKEIAERLIEDYYAANVK